MDNARRLFSPEAGRRVATLAVIVLLLASSPAPFAAGPVTLVVTEGAEAQGSPTEMAERYKEFAQE